MEKMDIYPYQRPDRKKFSNRVLKVRIPPLKDFIKKFRLVYPGESLSLMILAFFCGRAVLFGTLAPFGLAFSAGITAIFPEYGVVCLIFALAGYLTALEGVNLAATVAALLISSLVLWKYRQAFRQMWYGPPALVLGITAVVKIGVFAYHGAALYSYLTVTFEAVLASALTYIFYRAAPLLRRKNIRSFKWEERLFVIFGLVGLIAGLDGIQLGPVSVQRLVGCFTILIAVYIGGSGWGAVAGTLVGAVPSISSLVTPGLIGYFAFAGLVAGAFRSFGRIGISIGFLLGHVLMSIYFNGADSIVVALAEGLAASTLFMLIPAKFLHRVRNTARITFGELTRTTKDQQIRTYSARKIREFARVFLEVSKTLEQVSCDLQVTRENDLQQLFNGITSRVCSGCSLYRICWETEFYKTYKNVMDLLAALELSCQVNEEQLAPDLRKRCIRLKELAITVNCLYETYKTNHHWKRKLVESRQVVSGQLQGVSSILKNLADEVRLDVQMREDIEAILKSELAKTGLSVIELTVVSLGDEKIEVDITAPSCGGKMQCSRVINPVVSKILGQRMSVINNNYCTGKTGESTCEFKLHPARTLTLSFGLAQAAKDGNLVSGDSGSTIELRDGKTALLLSDGMGVGSKASMESKATVELLEQLLETGFDKSLAVKTVNSVLVLKNPEESFSTVDLTIVDQYSGKAEFMKIGAAPSFIKRPDRVDIVNSSSLPMGILNNIDVDCIEHYLNPGDVLIMVSDGVLDSKRDSEDKEEWLVTLVQSVITTDPQNIADLILNRAMQNMGGRAEDDLMVLVAEVGKVPVI